jgi:cytochrome c2
MKQLRSRTGKTVIVVLLLLLVGSVTGWAMAQSRIQEPLVPVPGGNAELGRQQVVTHACVTCHSIPGVRGPDSAIGPPLDNWAERHFVAGTQSNDPDALIAFLLDPQSTRPGTAMPDVGLTTEEATDIAAYLFTLYDDWPLFGGTGFWPLRGSP